MPSVVCVLQVYKPICALVLCACIRGVCLEAECLSVFVMQSPMKAAEELQVSSILSLTTAVCVQYPLLGKLLLPPAQPDVSSRCGRLGSLGSQEGLVKGETTSGSFSSWYLEHQIIIRTALALGKLSADAISAAAISARTGGSAVPFGACKCCGCSHLRDAGSCYATTYPKPLVIFLLHLSV